MKNNFEHANKIVGALLIVCTLAVSIPLTIKVFLDGGGPWGFGIIGFPILIPLSSYILFGFTASFVPFSYQQKAFIIALLVTFGIGAVTLAIFPAYSLLLVSIPFLLTAAGLIFNSRYKRFLMLMMLLGIFANGLLLKWELDFDRSIPVVQLFESRNIDAP